MEKMILPPREAIFPEVHTLDSKILDDYKELISSYEGKAFDILNIFRDRKGDLVGSNCFAPLKLREFLPEGTRLATKADLGRAIKINPGFLKGFYSDTGLTLITAGDSYKENDFLAKDLAKQLKKRKITLDSPKVIYFDALDLRDCFMGSVYGLAYNLNERAALGVNIIDAPELTNGNLYTKDSGLSRLCLGGVLGLVSDDRNLGLSDDSGRVVVVTDKGLKLEG